MECVLRARKRSSERIAIAFTRSIDTGGMRQTWAVYGGDGLMVHVPWNRPPKEKKRVAIVVVLVVVFSMGFDLEGRYQRVCRYYQPE
jgi:hypothetical protein